MDVGLEPGASVVDRIAVEDLSQERADPPEMLVRTVSGLVTGRWIVLATYQGRRLQGCRVTAVENAAFAAGRFGGPAGLRAVPPQPGRGGQGVAGGGTDICVVGISEAV